MARSWHRIIYHLREWACLHNAPETFTMEYDNPGEWSTIDPLGWSQFVEDLGMHQAGVEIQTLEESAPDDSQIEDETDGDRPYSVERSSTTGALGFVQLMQTPTTDRMPTGELKRTL